MRIAEYNSFKLAGGWADREGKLLGRFACGPGAPPKAALSMDAGLRPAAKTARFSGMNAPYGPNIAAAEYTHTLIIFIKKQIRQKEDVKTYEAISENDERRCCCCYASLSCSWNSRRHRLLLHLSLCRLPPTHSSHFPNKDGIDQSEDGPPIVYLLRRCAACWTVFTRRTSATLVVVRCFMTCRRM